MVEVRHPQRRERYWFDWETHILLRQETWESGDPLRSYEVHLFDQQPPDPRLFMPPKGAGLHLVRLPVSNGADSDFLDFWLLYTRLEPHWFEAATAGPEARLQTALAEQVNRRFNVIEPGRFRTEQMFYPTKLPAGYEFLGSDFFQSFKRNDREVRALFLRSDGSTLDTLTFAQGPTQPTMPQGVEATVHGLPARYNEEAGLTFPLRWVAWEEDGNRLTLRASGLSREDLLKLAEAVRSRPLKEIQQDPQVTPVDNFPEAAARVHFPLFAPTWWPDDHAMRCHIQVGIHRLLPELQETPRVTLYLPRTFDTAGKPLRRFDTAGKPLRRSKGEEGEVLFEQWPGPAVLRPPERIPTEAVTIHGRPGWFYEKKTFFHRLVRYVFWAEGETALALHSDRLTREQLLKVAESVKPVAEAGEAVPAMDPRIAQRLQAAIKALEGRDADALYAVSHPQERAELNVTRATLQRLLSAIFRRTGPLRARAVVEQMSNQCGDVSWTVGWEPVGGPRSAPARPFIAVVEGSVAPDHDWAVKVTTSLYWLCQRAWGYERGTEAYIQACRASGVGGILGAEGRLARVEKLEQRLRDQRRAE